MWSAQFYPFQKADKWVTSGGLGTMGFGLPAMIGAQLVRKRCYCCRGCRRRRIPNDASRTRCYSRIKSSGQGSDFK
nr:thiamine pyrophosphate-dependent enzyme [Bacillus subtilis]